jgi:hypothetical protein
VKDDEESGQHYSLALAPILAAFTLPTIALIVTNPSRLPLKDVILSLFVASTGLLLASFQLAVGRLFNPSHGWGRARAFLTGFGLILLGAALALLVWPFELAWPWKAVTSRDVLYAGLAVLVIGILFPICMNGWLIVQDKRGKREWDKFLARQPYSRVRPPTITQLGPLSADGEEKNLRVLALMQKYPSVTHIDKIFDFICRGSPTERRAALRAAIRLLPDLDDPYRTRLSVAVQLLSALDD